MSKKNLIETGESPVAMPNRAKLKRNERLRPGKPKFKPLEEAILTKSKLGKLTD